MKSQCICWISAPFPPVQGYPYKDELSGSESGSNDVVSSLVVIGAFDWAGSRHISTRGIPSLTFHYACILGNQLLLKIKRSEGLVSIQIIESDA